MQDGSEGDPKLVHRRDFLKLGALGAAASISGCRTAEPVTVAGETPGPGGPQGPGTGGGPEGGPGQARLPEIGNLVDPAVIPAETWQEPWVWRPGDWPESPLVLNVTRNQSPGNSPSPGNPTPSLFNYNGSSMGPTVRVRGDGEVRIKIRNLLGLDEQASHLGPSPDPVDMPLLVDEEVCRLVEAELPDGNPEEPRPCNPFLYPELLLEIIAPETRPGWSIKGHLNGQHRAHHTNLHTHGLHVAPGENPDGTHSDNVFLRLMPRADMEARLESGDPGLAELGEHEHVGELDYKIELSLPREGGPHPPGTHWYHPHSHGATHDQVASGMAGFLIVEGDVDEAVNRRLTGGAWPEPDLKTGPWDYRERLIFIQRVFVGSIDLDAGRRRNTLRFPPGTAVNGVMPAAVMTMRPGAVERWRVLNGSVDGAGTKRFMVLEGQYVQRDNRIWRVKVEEREAPGGEGEVQRLQSLEPVTEAELEAAKLPLYQLSFDGITLVSESGGDVRHVVKDLSLRNEGTANPFSRRRRPGESEVEARLTAFEDCYRDGDSLRRAYVRPNELYLGNANRADVFFRAPRDAAGKVFTVFAKEAHLHTDNYQSVLQTAFTNEQPRARRPLFDVVVAYVHVRGEPVEGEDFELTELTDVLPPVPPLFHPVREAELRIPEPEARATRSSPGTMRTRVISYSGTGGADFPVVRAPDDFCDAHPELENLVWGTQDGQRILLANLTRTMAVNTEFDLAANPSPRAPRKFMPDDPERTRVLVDTAEEWVLYNCSQPLWSHTDLERYPQRGAYRQHYESYPMSRVEGQRRFWQDPEFQITVKGSDHPFHIHINPMWVLRIDVPDETGALHNILPEPCWMDTVPIPRDGGRVVFRTRFDDYVGRWVHHCHILLHEDMGMMQAMDCVEDPIQANYRARGKVADHEMEGPEVDRIYPRPSRDVMYGQSMRFVDPNELGGQVYPGFPLGVPQLDEP
ncbi:MAG: multicopper oxidase domain-containing protein [Gemmatimonadales bacterium]|nr:MAG: multicopper oxidase domain-containing protein [Gemmatimonadales bacterium]